MINARPVSALISVTRPINLDVGGKLNGLQVWLSSQSVHFNVYALPRKREDVATTHDVANIGSFGFVAVIILE